MTPTDEPIHATSHQADISPSTKPTDDRLDPKSRSTIGHITEPELWEPSTTCDTKRSLPHPSSTTGRKSLHRRLMLLSFCPRGHHKPANVVPCLDNHQCNRPMPASPFLIEPGFNVQSPRLPPFSAQLYRIEEGRRRRNKKERRDSVYWAAASKKEEKGKGKRKTKRSKRGEKKKKKKRGKKVKKENRVKCRLF